MKSSNGQDSLLQSTVPKAVPRLAHFSMLIFQRRLGGTESGWFRLYQAFPSVPIEFTQTFTVEREDHLLSPVVAAEVLIQVYNYAEPNFRLFVGEIDGLPVRLDSLVYRPTMRFANE